MAAEIPFGGYREARAYLGSLKARGVSLGLERMEKYVEALGRPERRVPCIHIAGTNGKGSVAAMLEAIFRATGWRTGLYTSPHLVRLGERVQVDRVALSDEEITAYVAELRPMVAELEKREGQGAGPSYFEFMTGLAFLHFARSRCDIALIEVGLGGRLDATNVVVPEVSVITSIGLDHCEALGNTLAAIAREKAGIIKPARPIVIGRLPEEAESVVRGVAAERHCEVASILEKFGSDTARYPTTALAGEYQRINAATASLVAQHMPTRWRLDVAAIERGLSSVDWSGRWQTFSAAGRRVIVDCSHNAEGAQVLETNLIRVTAESGRPPIVIAGVLGRPRAEALVPVISRHARELHFVTPAQGRACSFEELSATVPAGCRAAVKRGEVHEIFPSAGVCAAGAAGDTIVVTGSIYLAGEVLARLEPSRGRAETELQDF